MIRKLTYLLTFWCWMIGMYSCQDDAIVQDSDYILDGEATVSAKVSFKPFGSALNGGSRTAGDAIKEIKSLYVLLYDQNQEFIDMFNATAATDYNETDEPREGIASGSNDEHIAEEKTPCATFKKKIPYGKYYIYAVANYDLPEDESEYDTIDKLRNLPLTWDTDNVQNNSEMFGYFTTQKDNPKPNGWIPTNPVTIASPSVNLHAWIRRAASKVTVAYDASDLNENIFIYLKSVTIKDIPKQCYLGNNNAPGDTRIGISNELLQGETIYYKGSLPEHTADDYTQWPRIARGAPYYYYMEESGNPENLDNAHTEGMNALFFYENYQNDYESTPNKEDYDKRQDGNGDGKLDEPGLDGDETYKPKDNVKYGTYIEVEGYYENRSNVNVSRGKIFYRFMLGKNTTYNYQAERNYHYKLTLKFKGDANDADWHIEYTETPGIYVPNPWYVSYLYEQSTIIPVKISGNPIPLKDSNGKELDAVLHGSIIKSDWYPYTIIGQMPASYYKGNVYTSWNSEYPIGDGTDEVNGPDGQPWNGFLSLKSTDMYTGPDNSWGYKTTDETSNNFYYWNTNGIGVSFYSMNPTPNDYHRVSQTGEDSYIFEIPMWTRQKNLITATGFTGNNIYVGNLRMAKVLFKARINDYDNLHSEYVNIIQVRRMVNPKGIYRKYDSTEPFQVTLMYQETQYSGNFVPLVSEGEWEAVIEKGADWITLNGKQGGRVYGATGSIVSFSYAPADALQDENKVRCGIIRVRYHNKSCSHLIFVRQGYAPLRMTANGPSWYTFNMYDKEKLTNSPLEEGSLFRHGNWTDAILASNNTRPYFGFGENIADGDNQYFLLANNTSKTWSDISYDDTFEGNDIYRIPTLDEWNALKNLEIGTGVLYGDGAKGTASTIAEAYGYNRTDGGGSTMGMRGYFIYDKTSGNNIFFPIGYEGYGRRKREFPSTSSYGYEAPGTLRYAQRTNFYETIGEIEYRPMFWDIYKSNGAVYWCTEGNAWDMNYHTLDFSSFNKNAYTDSDSDACFIRCVVNE